MNRNDSVYMNLEKLALKFWTLTFLESWYKADETKKMLHRVVFSKTCKFPRSLRFFHFIRGHTAQDKSLLYWR